MVIVGALVRVAKEQSQAVQAGLAQLEGVDVRGLEDPTKLALVIEAESLNHAYRLLEEKVTPLPGIWTVHPVYANFEEAAMTS